MPTPHLDTSTFAPDEPTGDAHAVAAARREVQTLAGEVARLAKTDIAPGEFYEQLLTRTVSALAAAGGAVWMLNGKGELEIADWKSQISDFQSAISNFLPAPQHTALLRAALDDPAGRLVAPRSDGEAGGGNPTDFLLVLAPFGDDEGPRGVLEIFQRPDAPGGARRGFLQFARRMGELAGDYEKMQRLKQLTERQALWEQRDRFAQAVHESLDSTAAAYTIANEGRRLIGCDRASVALGRGGDARVAAVSGQDAFDARSNVVARLAQLAAAVAATGEPLWYAGDAENLAPQVERALQAYLDVSHAKAVAVLPLMGGSERGREGEGENTSSSHLPLSPSPTPPLPLALGALVVDQIHDCRFSEETKRRIEAVAEHGGAALANAVEHGSLFLMPLWRALGRMKWIATARGLPRALTALLALACVAAALALVPADFEIEVKGVLRPVERRDVFAAIDGVVTGVPVEHGQMVEPGQPLALLRNTDLEVRITDLTGRREATAKQMQSVQRALLAESRLGVEEKNRLSGQLLQLRKTYESLELQLDLYRRKQEQLQVVSPIAGQIVTWQVRERLLRRPVRQGQVLMNVADPNGPWELELHMPEDRMGHIAQAARASDAPLKVTYLLATHPGESHVGRVEKIEAAAQVRGAEGSVVLIDVTIDKSDLADLRPGATVSAKVHCGRRSIGYVWLHDLFAFVEREILFRL